jgi:endonuclease YncB( thermonuclease family)
MMNRRILTLVLVLLAQIASGQEVLRVRVKAILDGDTIVVHDPRGRDATVWIEGIEAPEYRQAYAARSKYALRNLISMRTVTVIPRSLDSRSRIVGKVLLGDLDVGLEQVRQGFAWYDDGADLDGDDHDAYEQAQEEARAKRLGLWQAEHPVPPWEYRRYRR